MNETSHHQPLVAFTSLAIAGAGAIAADAVVAIQGGPPRPVVPAIGLALLAAGLVISLVHLGKRGRFPLAVLRIGRSRLSTEVVLGPLVLAGGAASLATSAGSMPGQYGYWAATILALSFLAMVGLVYHLGGQLTWKGATALTPASAGMVVGMAMVDSFDRPPGALPYAILFVLVDAIVFMLRWRRVTALAVAGHTGEDSRFDRRHELLLGRLLLLDAIPFVLLTVSPSALVPLVAAAGLVVDRLGFYALGVQHTTEREVASIERVIERTAAPPEA